MYTEIINNHKKEIIEKINNIPVSRIDVENYLVKHFSDQYKFELTEINNPEYLEKIDVHLSFGEELNLTERDRCKRELNWNKIDIKELKDKLIINQLRKEFDLTSSISHFYDTFKEYPIVIDSALTEFAFNCTVKQSRQNDFLNSSAGYDVVCMVSNEFKEYLKKTVTYIEKVKREMPVKMIEVVRFNTVFGRNFNYVETLWEYMNGDFLDANLVKDDFYKVFLMPPLTIKDKVNLCNGILHDYGYLIHKLKSFFLSEFQDPTAYNTWWAKNFKFNKKEKNHTKISKIVSKLNQEERQEPKQEAKEKIDALIVALQELNFK